MLDALWSALANDVHDLKCLKSRQLGISTICKPLVLFWMGVHDGIQGGMIFDTDQHKEGARRDIEDMIAALPAKFKFPEVSGRNRYGLRLANRSFLNFMAAGVKNSRSAGVLGRSSGLALVWASEMCSWNNDEGLASLKSSIAQENPNRLYLWESTARGPGIWKQMWEEAKADDLNQAAVFIGWWAKETQRIRRDSPAFARYGMDPPTEAEKARIDEVKRLYDYDVDQEQLAWYRRFSDPLAKGETDAPDIQDGLIQQDQPWTEEEAFILTGSTFFSNDRLNHVLNTHASKNYKAFKFIPAVDFTSCQIIKARTWRESELRIWEEPEPNAAYVLAADPAYGHSEKNDTSAVEIFHCYADCLEQAAEYRSGSIMPHQLAWLIWTLVGYYGSGSGNGMLIIIELNGPGEAVWREVGLTRQIVQNGYLKAAAREKGISNIFQNARQYIYGRSDAMNAGHNYHWKTTPQLKVAAMERFRDYLHQDAIILKSAELITEMRDITRDGDTIEAEGHGKDDRTFTCAMAVRGYEEKLRRTLISQNRTKQAAVAAKRLSMSDQAALFNQFYLENFFRTKSNARILARAGMQREQWRRGY